jgi:ubiquinone/menaquinone biosynthesis C-methylase UbiE
MTRQGRPKDPEPHHRSDSEIWDHMAAWWGRKQGEQGNPWHRTLTGPVLERVLGDVGGLRVLEVACGNGYLARRMARRGAHVTAVDGSEGMTSCARERERQAPSGVEYLVGDAADLSGLADGSFGAVVANMALMGISDAGGAR